ncbi:MAG TPA: serine/threonine-protein kinase [Mycobacterium sp.]|nr:serine/threonine-protein kinase [Mycobacterium sp.]
MPLAPGASFAGYTILRMLGTRGRGEVYLAQHPRLPRRDALKILPAAMTDDSAFYARFRQEAKIATTLHHPHIVQVHDRGECEGRLWTAMDYVDATDVAELMRQRFPAGMPPGQAQAIITAIAQALDYAHQRGMLHRDVQPARILLTNTGGGEHRVLLTDFGIAGQLDDDGTSAATGLPPQTRPYAAPEQLLGSEIDGRADQYGLAATAFHLLTGAPPYADPDPAAVTARANVSDRRVDLARFDSVFSTAFADDPADRFASCLEFAQALTERAAPSPGERTSEAVLTLDYPGEAADTSKVRSGEDVPTQMTSRLRRRVLLGIAFGAGLLLSTALLAVGFLIGQKNETTATEAKSPGTVTTTVAAAPTARTTSAPPLVLLDGGYRLDLNRVQQTYNSTPDPQPPNVATWWAFRSSCTAGRCLASGVLLDDANHQTPNAAAGGLFIVLDLRADAWQSRPETVRFPCTARNGTAALETTTQVLSLRPQSHSSLQGTMTVTVQTNECGQLGGRIVIPAVAVRVSDVPPGVDVPSPPPMTTPTR